MEKCFACGKDEVFQENLCIDCFLKKNNIIKRIGKISLLICPRCGKGNFNYIYNEWEVIKKDLIERIEKEVKFHPGYSPENISFDYDVIGKITDILMNTSKTRFMIDVNIDIKYKDKQIPLKIEIPIISEKKECKHCSKLASDGFTATLQIRSIFDKDIDHIVKFVKKEIKKNDKEVLKFDEKKEGINFKFFSKSFAYNILRRLKKNFYGYTEKTRTLHTLDWETSKKVYRSMFLYNYLGLKKDDFFIYNEVLYRIKDERKLIAYSQNSKKQFYLDHMKRARLPIKRKVMILNKNEAMDLEDYRQYPIEKFVPQSEVTVGKEVEAILYQEKIIL
ncbi:MAG: NMD3-related protein [Candidatus Woesearchaeota archaeon]